MPILRVADGPYANTLARQMLFLLRQQARDSGLDVIRITDPHPSESVLLACLDDGFVAHDSVQHALVLNVVDQASEVEHRAILAARSTGLPEPAPLRPGMPAVAAAELERAWWPAKIIDSQMSTFVVPIKQAFSVELLGVPAGLFPRQSMLGLSREHVYYRSPFGPKLRAPARLLWYMSGSGGRDVPPGVVACSHLDDVVYGAPSDLHSRFRHLGVWNIGEIERVSREGVVQALRFTNTDVFRESVGLKRLRDLGQTLGEHVVPQAPLQVSPALFAAILGDGRGSGG